MTTMSNTTTTKKKLFKGERTASTIVICTCLVGFLLLVIFDIVPAITAVLAALAATATFEVTRAVGTKSKILFSLACTVSLFTVLAEGFAIAIPPATILICIYALVLMCLMVAKNKDVKFTHCATAFFASLALPFAFLCFLRLNNLSDWFPAYTHHEGVYFVGLGFSCSWFTDTFAYLVGRKFGKHKMAPVISPKKSIEGAVGGIVLTAVMNVLILYLFTIGCRNLYDYTFLGESAMKYLYIVPISMIGSFISMMGDLAASVIKRNFGIKDYSQLLPGHGGIMDRFDSCIFVLPTIYCILKLLAFYTA